jgi:3-hydroxyacyl-CoA dehydrogenase
VVIAIDGYALGGGLEIALAAPYRVAAARARLGMPEVHLGVLPGAGGTQRGTRLMGPESALDLILSGRQVTAKEALSLGLVDAVAEDNVLDAAIAFAREKARSGTQPPPILSRTDKVAEVDLAMFDRMRRENALEWTGMIAPQRIVDCVEAACTLTPAEGLAFEWRAFVDCFKAPTRAAQVHLFFAERAAAKLPGSAATPRPGAHWSVAILGKGSLADAIDRSLKAHGVTTVPNATTGDADLILDLAGAADDADRARLAEVGRTRREGAVLVTLAGPDRREPVAEAAGLAAGQVPGLCLDWRDEALKLAEVVRSSDTPDESVALALALAKRIGKTGVICTNLSIRERLARARHAAVATIVGANGDPAAIDAALVGFGMRPPAAQIGEVASDRALRDDLARRVAAVIANEGARLIEEGVAQRASDVDLVSVQGDGFPRFRGGVMFWASTEGLGEIAAEVCAMGVQISALLEHRASLGGGWEDQKS